MWNGVSYTQSVDLRSKRKILRCITFVYYITANAELWCKDSVFLVGNKINYCRLWRSQSSNKSRKDLHAEDTPFSVYQLAILLLKLSICRKMSF